MAFLLRFGEQTLAQPILGGKTRADKRNVPRVE